MAEVHFVGELQHAIVDNSQCVAVSWSIVPGNSGWSVRSGLSFGETHAAEVGFEHGRAVFNHPIDLQFDTSTSEGWPFFICEVRLRLLSEKRYDYSPGLGKITFWNKKFYWVRVRLDAC